MTESLPLNTPSTNPVGKIPLQLIEAGARFIKVKFHVKKPLEMAWEQFTYSHEDPDLLNWIDHGGNYGVISHNGIGTIDIDDLEVFQSLGLAIPDTFTDCREGCRFHVFFKCDEMPPEWKSTKQKTTWGDIRFPGHNSFVVGTGCIATNKKNELKVYEINNPSPVQNIKWSVLWDIVSKSTKGEEPASDDDENEIIDGETKKKPYVMEDGVKKNHYTIISYVGSEMAKNVPMVAIHASCAAMNENGFFDRKRTPDELTKEIDDAIGYCIRKQAAKKKDKEKEKDEKHILLPGGIITPEMKTIIDTHHPNVAIAHCLNTLIGSESPDGCVIRWNKDQESWFCWNGTHWNKDDDGLFIVNYAEQFLYRAMEDAAKAGNKSFISSLLHTQSVGNVKGAMFFLKGMVAVNEDVFDTNPSLFNVQNGTINLTTGKLKPFDKDDYITRISNVNFVENSPSVKWDAHLKLVIPDEETRKAFQMYMGYAMLGGNAENTALFLYGNGKNGKSETVSAIAHVHGSYAMNSQPQTFYERMNDDNPRPDIARMKGARFIGIPEGRKGKPLDEGLLKQLTGGDVVTARYLYGKEFDFIPTGSLVFFTNHLPKISGRDVGIWRRIYPVPFKQEIPKDQRVKDYHKVLVDEESSGILNWMLAGLKKYQDNKGLFIPDTILKAKESYKATEDVLADFMSGYIVSNIETDYIARKELYDSYKLLAGGEKDVKIFPKAKFNNLIAERVGDAVLLEGTWIWRGIRVRISGEEPQKAISDF